MVLPSDGPAGDTLFAEQFAQFRMKPRIIPFPKRAKGIFFRVARLYRFSGNDGRSWQFINQLDVAIRAPSKPFSILGFANRTEHGSGERVYYTPSSSLSDGPPTLVTR
jgi:hypothetical protein